MLTPADNDKLTRVGPGTPMGKLMRWYWQPIAASAELDENPVKRISLLGEELVLYRDGRGRLGLVENRCAHRLVRLEYGYPAQEGIRCPYHGWTYDGSGACVLQPAEPADSTFKDKIKLTAYPVEELSGLIFAYLGPAPTPLLPRWEPLVMPGTAKRVSYAKVPTNWCQAMEMSADQVHVEWVHGKFGSYVLENRIGGGDFAGLERMMPMFLKHAVECDVSPYRYGLLRRRVTEGGSHDDESWSVGQPMIFPNMHMTSSGGNMTLAWRVPDDDTNDTEWIFYCGETPWAPGQKETTVEAAIPYSILELKNDAGEWNLGDHYIQDHLIFVAQGDLLDRRDERLSPLDAGVVEYRKLLSTQIDISESGGEPMNVFRDAGANQSLTLPVLGRRAQKAGSGG
jgi:5,5'-dehydrodivanillate O-demethylase oxygenase subunit